MASLVTIDASVFVNAYNPREEGHAASREFLHLVRSASLPMIVPTLILPEVAAVLTRAQADPGRARAFSRHLEHLPNLILVPLDAALARESVQAATRCSLRGSDAVYAALALRFGSVLVSRDRQRLERVGEMVRALKPEQAIAALA